MKRTRAAVLLVDDDPMLRRLGRRLLVAEGFAVVEAAGGRRAIEILDERSDEIGLIVSDLIMADIGGVELHRYVTERYREVPFVVTSGLVPGSAEAAALPDGVHHVQKPWVIDDFLALVAKLMTATGADEADAAS